MNVLYYGLPVLVQATLRCNLSANSFIGDSSAALSTVPHSSSRQRRQLAFESGLLLLMDVTQAAGYQIGGSLRLVLILGDARRR